MAHCCCCLSAPKPFSMGHNGGARVARRVGPVRVADEAPGQCRPFRKAARGRQCCSRARTSLQSTRRQSHKQRTREAGQHQRDIVMTAAMQAVNPSKQASKGGRQGSRWAQHRPLASPPCALALAGPVLAHSGRLASPPSQLHIRPLPRPILSYHPITLTSPSFFLSHFPLPSSLQDPLPLSLYGIYPRVSLSPLISSHRRSRICCADLHLVSPISHVQGPSQTPFVLTHKALI
jgi:hypothetical protein